jgi:hypothetical protein
MVAAAAAAAAVLVVVVMVFIVLAHEAFENTPDETLAVLPTFGLDYRKAVVGIHAGAGAAMERAHTWRCAGRLLKRGRHSTMVGP